MSEKKIPRSVLPEVQRIHKKIRREHLKKREPKGKNKPVRFWKEDEVIIFEKACEKLKSLTIVLGTQGCEWAQNDPGGGCIFCGYLYDNPAKTSSLLKQINHLRKALNSKERKELENLKLYTSGSFLDPREIRREKQIRVLERLLELFPNAKILQIEARPEDLLRSEIYNSLSKIKNKITVYLNIGLESANEEILKLINKGLTLNSYQKAVKKAKNNNFKVKTYLLLKPPFLTEKEAIRDTIFSGKKALQAGTTSLSLNPLTVHSGTFVELLWKKGYYRPPWPQSLIHVLQKLLKEKTTKQVVFSNPIAMGQTRGIHGMGKNTKTLKNTLEKIVTTQDPNLTLPKKVLTPWKDYIEKEVADLSFANLI